MIILIEKKSTIKVPRQFTRLSQSLLLDMQASLSTMIQLFAIKSQALDWWEKLRKAPWACLWFHFSTCKFTIVKNFRNDREKKGWDFHMRSPEHELNCTRSGGMRFYGHSTIQTEANFWCSLRVSRGKGMKNWKKEEKKADSLWKCLKKLSFLLICR